MQQIYKKYKARKFVFIAAILIAVFVFFSIAYAAYENLVLVSAVTQTDNIISSESAVPSTVPVITPEPRPRAAFIPDPDELQPMPSVSEIEFTKDTLLGEFKEDDLNLSWNIVEDADYYVLYALNEYESIYHKEILWPDISEWLLPDALDGTVYLFSYKDMGKDGAQDDKIVDSFTLSVAKEQSTPDTFSTPLQQIQAAEPQNKYMIIVDKADFTFAAFTHDETGEYTLLAAAFPTAIGTSDRMTPNGTFEISSKGAWKSWSTGSHSPYYTRFTSGLYFHGAVYSDKLNYTMYKSYYNDIGTAASSGCLRTTFEGAKWVYYNCPAGTIVKIVSSSDMVDKVEKPPLDPAYPRWDPTDPDKPHLNPPAVIVNDLLKITEGESAELTGYLRSIDEKIESQDLIYDIVTPPSNGTLSKNQFTQKELDSGEVFYTHDGSETETDSFQFTVTNLSSKTGVMTLNIIITLIDDSPPVIVKNEWMEISQGASCSLELLLLSEDDETDTGQLIYIVTQMPEHGSIPAEFSQNELLSGAVLYEQDGSETETDSFIFSVSDGTNTVENQMFSISIELPVFIEFNPQKQRSLLFSLENRQNC